MEEKIILTEEELSHMERYMDGDIDLVACDEDMQKVFTSILDKVDYYEELYNAEEERMNEDACDGIVWLYNCYMKQNGKEARPKNEKKFIE